MKVEKSGTSTVREVIRPIKIIWGVRDKRLSLFFCLLIASSAFTAANSLTQAIVQTCVCVCAYVYPMAL